MLRKPIVILVLMCVHCSVASSQELHEWKSRTGHTTRAALLKVDEDSRKVTLLIPKEIDFDKLDADSIALARKLAPAVSERLGNSPIANPELDEMGFLLAKYEALTEFKASSEFAEWGFAIGGPYNTWLKDVQKAKNTRTFESEDVAFAIGHLLTLGLEYKDSKGKETEYAGFANDCIRGILAGHPRDEFERRAIAKVQSIMSGRSGATKSAEMQPPARQPTNAEYMYVEDDFYPDIYAFRSFAQLKHYWGLPQQNSDLTARERHELGIELVESKTRILIISRIPHGPIVTIYEFEPTTGRNKGKRLFTTSLNVYDSLR